MELSRNPYNNVGQSNLMNHVLSDPLVSKTQTQATKLVITILLLYYLFINVKYKKIYFKILLVLFFLKNLKFGGRNVW